MLSDSTFASTASKAWSTSTISHDMVSETDRTIKQLHLSIQDNIKHDFDDSREKHAAISTPPEQTMIQSNTIIYQSPSVEDSRETLTIDSGRCLPAEYKYILESSTDYSSLGASALPAVVPTPNDSDRETTQEATTSPENRDISTKYHSLQRTSDSSSDESENNIAHMKTRRRQRADSPHSGVRSVIPPPSAESSVPSSRKHRSDSQAEEARRRRSSSPLGSIRERITETSSNIFSSDENKISNESLGIYSPEKQPISSSCQN